VWPHFWQMLTIIAPFCSASAVRWLVGAARFPAAANAVMSLLFVLLLLGSAAAVSAAGGRRTDPEVRGCAVSKTSAKGRLYSETGCILPMERSAMACPHLCVSILARQHVCA
jgi:hypothetical protein